MAESTGIEWCDATFNPWIGCEKVSPGCAHCYAETLVTGRMGRAGTWGADGVRQRTSPSNWRKPLRWEQLAQDGFLPDGSENRDGHRPRIFCASLADVFEPRPELESWRVELWNLIDATPSIDWLLLTKRPEEARDWLQGWYGMDGIVEPTLAEEPNENVWIGTSIENARHTYRADVLREVPAAVRFISAEPLLGSLLNDPRIDRDQRGLAAGVRFRAQPVNLDGIDWLIAGGESGPRHRPMQIEWARELRDACVDAGVAFFFKQWGGRMAKTGGKVLDGRQWCEFPRTAVLA